MMKREQGSSDAVTGLIESIEHGGILVLVMTAPRRNRLMASLRAALGTALDRASSSPAIRAVLITGAAGDFSEGRGPALPQPDGAPGLEKLCARIADLGKPVVAALDGAVLDGGMDIALAASVRLAAPGASLGFPGVARGLVPEGGGGQRLARLAGADTALRLLLTGVPVRAAAALALGLVDLVVPARHLPATALERARALADAAEAVVDAGAVPADAGQNSGQNPGQIGPECGPECGPEVQREPKRSSGSGVAATDRSAATAQPGCPPPRRTFRTHRPRGLSGGRGGRTPGPGC